MKFTGVILAGGRGLQLYPLTPRFCKALLPVGNKRMIMYQLEMLEKANVTNVVVLINEQTRRVEQEVTKGYKGKTPISIYCSSEESHTYTALSQLLNNVAAGRLEDNIVIVSSDLITSIQLRQPLQRYSERKLDFLMIGKAPEEKKPVKEKEKKEEEPELELLVVSSEDNILYADTYDESDHSAVQISNGVLRKHNSCRFERVIDPHIYILSKRVCNIVKQLKHEDLGSIKQDFVPFLVKNQNNRQLLKFTEIVEEGEHAAQEKTLSAGVWFEREVATFCKRIIDIKDYQAVNMLTLVRGPKEIPVLLPTVHTEPLLATHNFEATTLAQSAELKEGVKIRRSCIAGGVRIGRNTEIVNSIVLPGAIIDEECKLYNCIVGNRAHVHKNSRLKQCQLGSESQVSESSETTNEIIIKAE